VHTFNNAFISSLTKADQLSLLKGARETVLTAGEILSSPNQNPTHIYFPTRGSIALYISVKGNSHPAQGLAVGLIGAEGAAGLELALGFGRTPFHFIVQSSGHAYAVEADIAKKLIQRRPKVLLKISQQLWSVYESIASFAAKAYTKDIKIRLAHWLLLSASKCSPDPLRLTHLQIAKMLGVRRSSISIAAREIKLKRYINYSRGQVTISDIEALKQLSNS
jgi:CRP-like cAMP-binding protein